MPEIKKRIPIQTLGWTAPWRIESSGIRVLGMFFVLFLWGNGRYCVCQQVSWHYYTETRMMLGSVVELIHLPVVYLCEAHISEGVPERTQ